jgi:hypothetical protein
VLAGALKLFLVSLGLTHDVTTVGAGLRVIRRARKARRDQGGAGGTRGRRGQRANLGRRAGIGNLGIRAGRGPRRLVSAGWGRLRTRLETAEDPAARAGLVVPPEDCVVYYLIPRRARPGPAGPSAQPAVRTRPVALGGGQSPRRAGAAGPAFWPLAAALPS